LGGNEQEVMSHSFSAAESNGVIHDRPTIIVIDCRALSRSCLARVLKSEFPDFTIVEVETVRQFDSVVGRPISLITLDVGSCVMTDERFLQNLAHIHRSAAEGPPIVLFTGVEEATVPDAMIVELTRLGVKGCVTTAASIEIALAALRLVIAGGIYFPRSVMIDVPGWPPAAPEALPVVQAASSLNGAARVLPAISSNVSVNFTGREQQVLATLLRGMSNKVIANELKMSQNTVKSHISRIMQKLHARNRTEAVILSQYSRPVTNGGASNGASDA
jgi:DNA-binding NarL/FixJ family response regulator